MQPLNKILVVRFSSIGDIVLTTPVLRCLKQQTAANIDVLTKKSFSATLENNPHINKLHTVEKSFTEILPILMEEQYDLIVDLQHNLHSWKLKRTLGVKTLAFPKLNIEKWLIVNTKINILPKQHIVDRYLSTVQSLGVKNDGKGLDYFIPTTQEVDTASFLPSKEARYVAFVIGAAHATKRLPTEKIISICQKISYPIVLLGGKDEAEKGDLIAKSAGNHVWNACGKFNLHQSASWVRQSQVIITHDTGLMHIAAAFSKKIISIWGNTIPAFGMYPYYPKGINYNISIEVDALSCRPCSKIGHHQCPKGHFKCMNNIDENNIINAVKHFWTSY